MAMPEMIIDVEVWCTCGEGLCRQAEIKWLTTSHQNKFDKKG